MSVRKSKRWKLHYSTIRVVRHIGDTNEGLPKRYDEGMLVHLSHGDRLLFHPKLFNPRIKLNPDAELKEGNEVVFYEVQYLGLFAHVEPKIYNVRALTPIKLGRNGCIDDGETFRTGADNLYYDFGIGMPKRAHQKSLSDVVDAVRFFAKT